jgi:hypothetical protein
VSESSHWVTATLNLVLDFGSAVLSDALPECRVVQYGYRKRRAEPSCQWRSSVQQQQHQPQSATANVRDAELQLKKEIITSAFYAAMR